MNQNKYIKNGLIFRKCNSFRVVYHDDKKAGANYWNYCNAGFFGNFRSAGGVLFTLPVGNLVCDPWHVPEEGRKYILPLVKNNKLRYSLKDNHSEQFKGRYVSTLIVDENGRPHVSRTNVVSEICQYAISGIPVISHGVPCTIMDYEIEGWDASPMYATSRNWIGVRNNQIWLISGKTTTSNYISKQQLWPKLKDEKFDNVLALDGGGSYIFRQGNDIRKTWENRRVNSLIVFT